MERLQKTIYGIQISRRGNFICPYCPSFRIYRELKSMRNHVETTHPLDTMHWLVAFADSRFDINTGKEQPICQRTYPFSTSTNLS